MESVFRNVRDIDTRERQLLEHVLGRQLKENQQVIIQVVTLEREPAEDHDQSAVIPSGQLPAWCNVFAGLTEKQVAEVEEVVLQRADLTRSTE
jgi:D-ribose pyranose/furanose isomerase RbsD